MPHKPKTFKPLGHSGRRASDADYYRQHGGDEARRLRRTARYQRFQRWIKRRNPLCADPFNVHDAPVVADDLHHIVAVEVAPEKLCEERNAAMLCRQCHNRITRMESKGEPTGPLFAARLG